MQPSRGAAAVASCLTRLPWTAAGISTTTRLKKDLFHFPKHAPDLLDMRVIDVVLVRRP